MNGPGPSAKSVDSGWFQRPYPYHLDYYRMRFHGSYAPYFGNYNAPPTNFNVGPTFAPGFGVGMYPPYAGWGQGPAAILPHQGGAVAPAPVAP